MEAEKLQRLHDTLSKLIPRGKVGGLGFSSFNKQSGGKKRDDGLPDNALYKNFVRAGHGQYHRRDFETTDEKDEDKYDDGLVTKKRKKQKLILKDNDEFETHVDEVMDVVVQKKKKKKRKKVEAEAEDVDVEVVQELHTLVELTEEKKVKIDLQEEDPELEKKSKRKKKCRTAKHNEIPEIVESVDVFLDQPKKKKEKARLSDSSPELFDVTHNEQKKNKKKIDNPHEYDSELVITLSSTKKKKII